MRLSAEKPLSTSGLVPIFMDLHSLVHVWRTLGESVVSARSATLPAKGFHAWNVNLRGSWQSLW